MQYSLTACISMHAPVWLMSSVLEKNVHPLINEFESAWLRTSFQTRMRPDESTGGLIPGTAAEVHALMIMVFQCGVQIWRMR